MKTTFLLHGGGMGRPDAKNNSYFRRLTAGLRDGDQVLVVGFARRDERERAIIFERDKQLILAEASANITCINATAEDVVRQLQRAKAVHITGGETPELIQAAIDRTDFVEQVRGKCVGGSSAGACLLAAFYCINDPRGVLEGWGMLPIRLRVHSDNLKFGNIDESLALLNSYPHDLALVLLKEFDWIERTEDI
jgi:hypothetical protein